LKPGFVAAVAALLLLSGCTAQTPVLGPTPIASVSPLGATPVPTATGPHHYSAGAQTADDPVYPQLGDGGYDVSHYAITIGYDPATKRLTGDDVVTATATQDLSRFSLDLRGLTVSSVTVNGVPAVFRRAADKLQVTPVAGIDVGTALTTRVVYGGVPVPYSDPILGTEGFLSYGSGEAIAQGEPQVAADWFPVDDRPSDKATYDVTVTAPSKDSALSNGVLVSKVSAGGKTTWHWAEHAPMASYLAMVAIGRYRVATSTHNGLPVVTAVDDSLPRSVDAQLAKTPAIIDFLATQFGPYPFDAEGGIAQTDPAIGFALENQTRPVYSAVFAHEPASDFTSIIVHELAHQWYGDSVSVADWSDVWLNEGFATYAQWLWTQHEGGVSPKTTFDELYRAGKLPKDPPAVRTPATEFGGSVYNRGAATLEALRISVGDATFFTIIQDWAAQRKYGNGSTGQFIALAESVSGKALGPMFQAWLYTPGRPPYPVALK
jgi:aminopeptidase N